MNSEKMINFVAYGNYGYEIQIALRICYAG